MKQLTVSEAGKVEQVSAALSEQRRRLIHSLSEDHPLRWALQHHRNTRNEQMTFHDAWALLDLYMNIGDWTHFCARKCVQFGLSDLFVILSHLEAGAKGMTVMYVLPKYRLRDRFVNNRIYKLHKKVPYYQQLVAEAHANVHRTSLMHFGAGTLVYVGSNVEDEFIEIPVDSAYIDERDKCNQDNLLYLDDRLSASPYRYRREIGNPTVDNYGISAEYNASSRATWKVRDDAVKYPQDPWFEMDFFQHVMREVDEGKYEVRDPNFEPRNDEQEIKIYGPSGKPVNRLQRGQWVHMYPKRTYKGVEISKLYARTTSLVSLANEWLFKVQGNPRKEQVFINSNLGKPYEAEGSKINKGALNAAQVSYIFPPKRVESQIPRYMGVDVGEKLHIVIREPIAINGQRRLRLVFAAAVPGFSQAARLIKEWKPKVAVFDSMPEMHRVADMKSDFDCVFSARFKQDQMELSKNDKTRQVQIDRTTIMDYVQEGYRDRYLVIPEGFETFDSGDYYKHLCEPTRLLIVNEENPEKSRYVWTKTSQPDHYFLAEAYAYMGSLMYPERDVWAFFERGADASFFAGMQVPHGDTSSTHEDREEIARKQVVSQDSFLDSLLHTHTRGKEVPPAVDDDKIEDVAAYMLKTQGYVDTGLVSNMCGEHEDDVKRIVRSRLGLSESRIRGQWVK